MPKSLTASRAPLRDASPAAEGEPNTPRPKVGAVPGNSPRSRPHENKVRLPNSCESLAMHTGWTSISTRRHQIESGLLESVSAQ